MDESPTIGRKGWNCTVQNRCPAMEKMQECAYQVCDIKFDFHIIFSVEISMCSTTKNQPKGLSDIHVISLSTYMAFCFFLH